MGKSLRPRHGLSTNWTGRHLMQYLPNEDFRIDFNICLNAMPVNMQRMSIACGGVPQLGIVCRGFYFCGLSSVATMSGGKFFQR